MSWVQELSKTYDNFREYVGQDIQDDGNILLPISHLTAQAQVEIFIDLDGNFIRAEKVNTEDAMTIIPVTENSASRGSGIAPMPLCDKLCYIAGDYDEYNPTDKSKTEYYEQYMQGLKAWADFPNSPRKVRAVYQYLMKKTVIHDLYANESFGELEDFARFIVEGSGDEEKVWKDPEMYKSYISFYGSTFEKKSLCYATGQIVVTTEKLPAKIRNTGDKAKLISSNDTSGYTYRGRFCDATETVGIGYETAQEAHNALRWLIAKQGYRNASESIIFWSPGGEKTPTPLDHNSLFFENDNNEKRRFDTAEIYAHKVDMALAGYRKDYKATTKIIVMAVDTADASLQGRLAITHYDEMSGKTFLDNLDSWYAECMWELKYRDKKTGELCTTYGTPSPKDIANVAYGTEQDGKLKTDDKVSKKCIDRILPCIIRKKRFPRDIIMAAVHNASSPERYSAQNFSIILSDTCALIRKYYIDKNREKNEEKEWYKMEGNQDNSRDYLFGKLLAIADNMENLVYYKESKRTGETIARDTNARRYWSTYAKRPARTWALLHDKLSSYYSRLSGGEKNYYTSKIAEIMHDLEVVNGFDNRALDERYLMGYYSQIAEFKKSKKENEEQENMEQENMEEK